MAASLQQHVASSEGFGEDRICEIEATVVTGMEQVAAEDARKILGVKVVPSRGHILIYLPFSQLRRMTELQSIDNYIVIINRYPDFQFAKNEQEVLFQLAELVPDLDWDHALAVWRQFFSFEHPIINKPQESWYPGISTTKPPPEKQNINQSPPKKETSTTSENSSHQSNDSTHSEQKSEESAKKDTDVQEPPAKKKYVNPLLPNFRGTCYRTGKSHLFTSPQAACAFGGAIQDYFGWNVNLKQHDIEVCLLVEDADIRVGIALTRESLHKRHVVSFGPTTLRPTIAYNMLVMCHIKPGDVVCDPMCGGGSIPIEAAINWPNAVHVCGDNHPQAVPRAKENIEALCKKRLGRKQRPLEVDMFHWDVTKLPLRDSSVDVFITDMPFGKRSGNRMSNWHLYPRTLEEMARVCKPSTGRACLLTHDRKCITKSIKSLHRLWHWRSTHSINIGGLAAAIFFLYRTSLPIGGTRDTSCSTEGSSSVPAAQQSDSSQSKQDKSGS